MSGTVYLVGGGPGDLDLLTCKAYRLIKEADCIVYDRLIDPKILEKAKENCECIYVGKENHNHSMKQEDINQLLVEKAYIYKTVVRLKGGDVYVFGRGGEEALYLREHQILFEIVPGISSAIAGLSYAGIPITHRGIAGGFHVVTAHNKSDELAEIDFHAMAKSEDTCVFLMGLTKLTEIVSHLIEAGKAGDTEIAVIANATLPTQQVLTSTLAHVIGEFEQHPLSSPALIVVGRVVALRDRLNFQEEKPLFGVKILLSKVGHTASAIGERLQALGALVCEVQTGLLQENREALDSIVYEEYTHIIVTSKNAVHYFMNSLHKNKIDVRTLHAITFVAIGPATRACLEEYGIYHAIAPQIYHQDALLACLQEQLQPNHHILFPKVAPLNEEGMALEQALEKICPVKVVALYENIPVEKSELKKQIEQYASIPLTKEMLVYTCSSSVRRSIEIVRQVQEISCAQIFSIGDKTSETLRTYGVDAIIQSRHATLDSLFDTIKEQAEYTQKRKA
ncbi:MAG: uroporphyrinogen-III C-methyltransferase [Lachnospiraceae bacterium]